MISILQLFKSDLYYDLIGSRYFGLVIFNSTIFILGIGFPQHQNVFEGIQLRRLTPYHKTTVRGKDQNPVHFMQFICITKVGEPTILNQLFLINLFDHVNVTSQSRKL